MPTVPPNTGNHVLASSPLPGLELLTANYTLYDARQSYINWHWGSGLDPSDTLPGHGFTGPNESGYLSDWPWIVPFNDGWISLQNIDYQAPDPHYSSVTDSWIQLTVIDKFGNWLETRRTEWTDWGSFIGPFGSYQRIMVIAGNQSNRLLIAIENHHETASVSQNQFYYCDFNPSDWSFVRTAAYEKPNDGSYDTGGIPQKQYDMGSGGYMVVSQEVYEGGGGAQLPIFLDADLDWIDPPSSGWPSAAFPFQLGAGPMWESDPRCHIIKWSVSSNAWTAYPIDFDGVTVTVGTTYTGSFAGTIDNNAWFNGNGMFHVHDWDVTTPPRVDNQWVPPDGSARYVAPNVAQVESVFYDSEGDAFLPTKTIFPDNVVDWNNQYPVTSPYDGNAWAQKPFVIRFNLTDWATKTAGYYDIEVTLPVPPDPMYDGSPIGQEYDDCDLDEAGFSIVNPWTGHILIWHYTYWRMQPRYLGTPPDPPDQGDPNAGPQSGANRLTTYWVFGTPDEAPPEAPEWVNFFNTEGVPDPDCPMLGSGESRVFLYDRGGTRKIAEIVDTTLVRWTRVRDDISKATVQVSAPRPECADVLRTVSVGRHELVIFRNGERVWEGPVTRTTDNGGIFEIVAEDICFYLARTIMHHAYDNRYSRKKSKVGPVTHRAQIILVTELQRKERLSPPVNILRFLDVRTHPKTTRTSRFTPAYASSVWEELDYMAAKLSLDYTAVGRRLLINDVHDTIGQTQMLTDKDFNNPLVITTYGRELATRSAVTDGEGHWAAVGGIDDYYGEWELLNTTYGEEVQPAGATPTAAELKQLQAEMASQAQRNLAGRYPVPAVVRVPDNTRLDPASPVTMDQLVPGVRIPIRATLAVKPMEQEQKLNSVTVEQTEAGEVVTVTMVAAPGSTPWDDSSETGADEEAVT